MKFFSQIKSPSKRKIPPVCYGAIFLYLTGFTVGYVAGHFFEGSLYAPLLTTYNEILLRLPEVDIDRTQLFILCLEQHLKIYLLLIFFAFTNVWIYYFCGFVLYSGLTHGLLLMFCTLLHGIGGLPEFLCFLLPQALIYIPLYLMIFCRWHQFHYLLLGTAGREHTIPVDFHSSPRKWQKGQLLLHQLPFLFLSFFFLCLGCFIEGYLNLPLILWYLGKYA